MRSCEGSLKKRGHCLVVNGADAWALVAPASISGKLSIRRVPIDQLTAQAQPRAVLRVANRGSTRDSVRESVRDAFRAPVVRPVPRPFTRPVARPGARQLEPFLQDLQNDVARLSLAFVRLGREANALVRAENQNRQNNERPIRPVPSVMTPPPPPPPSVPPPQNQQVSQNQDNAEQVPLSRSARKRMRQRVRAALNASQSLQEHSNASNQRVNTLGGSQRPNAQSAQRGAPAVANQRQNGPTPNASTPTASNAFDVAEPATPAQESGPSNGHPNNVNQTRANKKKRRQRR